ncbi:MAG: DUF58 domain-containing protein [Kiloniellales bacterium]
MPISILPLQQRAEQLAATLPPLLVAAERVAATVAQGVHGRRRVGQGETFWQFRDYEPGDAPQLIDWHQSAKSDRVFVRELEWEAAQSVWIWRDISPSMAWQSSAAVPEKRERADLLALALAVLLVGAGEHVSLLGSGLRPATGRNALPKLATVMARHREAAANVPPIEPLPRHAQLVLMGDFLAPLEEIDRMVRDYMERGVRGHLLQVLDPAETDLPYQGRVRFEGLEGEAPWLLSRVESVRGDYHERLAAQQRGLEAITRVAGWSYARHRTDHPPQTALLALYAALSQSVGL